MEDCFSKCTEPWVQLPAHTKLSMGVDVCILSTWNVKAGNNKSKSYTAYSKLIANLG